MIKRELENKLKKWVDFFPVVVILGPRQVGKTTLAKQIIPFLKKKNIHLDLEYTNDLEILSTRPEIFLEENKDKCIIIDEVQRMPSLFPLLRPIVDNHRVAGRFILLGSASPTLLKESSESLAGRVIYIELTPFQLLELSPEKDMLHLWLNGGFPEAFLIREDKLARVWYASFLNTYFERDLQLLGLNISPRILRRTFNMLAHMHGNLCNISNLSRSLGLDRRVIERIIEFFLSSYMLRELPPFYVNNNKRLIKTPKYYIRDSGILHHTLKINSLNELWAHPSIGPSWEGFVVEQVANLSIDLVPYFYRTRRGGECDLVLVQGHKPVVCIEAKMNNQPKITKSLSSSIQDLETKENFIVTPSVKHSYALNQNTTVCNLPWLLNHLKNTFS